MKSILLTILFSIFTFLVPIKGLLILMMLVIWLDTISGIYVAKKLGVKLTSHKFFNIVVKHFFYLSTIVLSYLVDVFILGGTLPVLLIPYGLSKIATIFWIINECKSMDENSQKLGNPPFWDLLKKYISKAKDLKKDLGDLTEKDKDKGAE